MKNILFNILDLKRSSGGTYQYSIALLKILIKGNTIDRFYILCENPGDEILALVRDELNFVLIDLNKVKTKQIRFYHRLANKFFRIFRIKFRYKSSDIYDFILAEYKIDIVHTPYQKSINKRNIKTITTLHDVQELHYPEFFTSEQRAYRAVTYKNIIDNADAVVVSYKHIKNDIEKYFNKPRKKIHTILLDMEDLWFETFKKKSETQNFEKNTSKKFLLYPAATWAHKNHLGLLKALKIIEDNDIHLICTGHKSDFFTNEIEPLIKELNLENKVSFLGIVSDQELYNLYNTCQAVVVPTLYEAGSFPLMESILMGIPVVCANTTSLPDVIGDEKFIFDPLDVKDMADKMLFIFQDEKYRSENLYRIAIQSEKLKHNNAYNKISVLYNELLDIK